MAIKTMLGKQLLDNVTTAIVYKERFEEFDLATVIKKKVTSLQLTLA